MAVRGAMHARPTSRIRLHRLDHSLHDPCADVVAVQHRESKIRVHDLHHTPIPIDTQPVKR